MLGQPFVNPVNFVFGALLGLVYYAKHSHHDFVIFAVLFAELVKDGDDDRPDCCDYSGDDQCPPCIHVRKVARTHGKRSAHYSEWLSSWPSIPSPPAEHHHLRCNGYATAQSPAHAKTRTCAH